MAAIDEVFSIIQNRSPVICPQIYPFQSEVSCKDVHLCLAGMFSEKQRNSVLKSLSHRQKQSDRNAGRKTILVMECEINVSRRVVIVKGLDFVSSIEAALLDTKKFVGMLAEENDDLDIYIKHFRSKNGYNDINYEPFVVQEVYSAAYSLQVLVDSIPDWKTLLGTHQVPCSEDVESVLESLFKN
mmetsp:Transcript_50873/g.65142  ORF Transcript_50873/g.65142 Transcript_50873/m.65142 type:complete len:185 (-) Transcript_50873:187-741(-)